MTEKMITGMPSSAPFRTDGIFRERHVWRALCGVGLASMLFVIAMASNLYAAGQPGGGISQPGKPIKLPPLTPPPKSPSESPNPDEVELNWQSETISAAIQTASSDKKIILIYFYFNYEKEQFPANYDTKLQKYSQERAVFAKMFVVTDKDKKGKIWIMDTATASFFDKNKLPFSAVALALDPYGNLMDKMVLPITISKIMPFLDAAQKKFIGIQTDLDKRYDKAEKLLKEAESNSGKDKENARIRTISEAIKTLKEIIKTPYEGYEAIKKSYDKSDNVNEKARKEYLALLKDYVALEKELQDPVNVVPELEKVMNTYKGLPVEQEIQGVIKNVKEGKIPENILKEIETAGSDATSGQEKQQPDNK